ncbi:hypothetical protein [Rhizobium sp. BK251]|uniref:hypothetical protein n=1 Tax=Rhizobium sp. BK251 TaxID=2512125 RepID=UPI00105225E9|nr:hypothetical protein [Rhizobium sp. BK251]TCL72606.1 hypothetical protein EV286_10428 [Rhizobium sp. BK251]
MMVNSQRTTTDSTAPVDSPETARRRTRYRWARGIVWANGTVFVVTGLAGNVLNMLDRDDLIQRYQILWILLAASPLLLFNYYVLHPFKRSLALAERRDLASQGRLDELTVEPVETLVCEPRPEDSPETLRLKAQHRRNVRGGWVALAIGVVSLILAILDFATQVTGMTFLVGFGAAIFIVMREHVLARFQWALALAERRDRASERRSDRLTVAPVEPLVYKSRPKDSPETSRLKTQHRRNRRGSGVALAIGVGSLILVIFDVATHVTLLTFLVGLGAALFIVVRDHWRGSLQTALAESMQKDMAAQHAADLAQARHQVMGPVL